MKKIINALLIILILTGCANREKYNEEVNVLNWSSYIPESVITNFEKEYNIKVNYGTYSSNEELLAKISSSKKGTYDLIFPSDYMVELMKNKQIIKKIDKTKIPNINNINSLFLNKEYDINNEYSLPFLSTVTTIAVNRENIKDEIKGYNDLLNEKYKNNIVVLDDQRITIGMALQALGYSMNETDSNRLNEAKKWLLRLKKNIKAFDSDSPKTFIITKETDIGIMWNAEAKLAQEQNNNIEIIYPQEGNAISTDNYCIVANAKNEDNAYLFINYLLRNDISQKIIEEYPYISTNKNVNQYSNHYIKEIYSNGSYVKNIGKNIEKYDRLWAEIK